MKNIKLTLFLIIFFTLISTICFGTDLDAPVEKKVTIRSEIKRGADAMFDCFMKKRSPISGTAQCYKEIYSLNQQKNTDTKPFLLGLYFRTWVDLGLSLPTSRNYYKKLGNEALYELDEAIANDCFKKYREIQYDIGLNDEVLCQIVDLKYDKIEPIINEWVLKKKR